MELLKVRAPSVFLRSFKNTISTMKTQHSHLEELRDSTWEEISFGTSRVIFLSVFFPS